ncbi:YaiO family outer membrane beta-barrel protein [Polaromonas sp. UBA4122]|uniref:YaiO family outer membrane beta-barrel protein n=1 Tax=Polaromonas sp. UBA4122 TaxID=1947074 RepID=UPI0025FA0AA6|nr:YaiO family outer membrane beta-barrel protein [Polaromonas sp. UBA4122]
MLKNKLFALLVLVANACPTQAQSVAQPVALPKEDGIQAPLVLAADEGKRSLELSAGSQSLSAGFGNWRDLTLRGTYGLPRNLLQGEVSLNRRFDTDGAFVGLSDTYTFNEDWFGSVALGVGDGAFYLPRYRVDATLYKKWLADRSLVSSVGVGYYDAPDGHTDRSLSLGAAYYFASPWIVEGGVRLNNSNPGSVRTQQQFVAVTYGRDKQDLVSARYTWGSEGYLAVAANTQLVDFDSREASVAWRHWLDQRTGLLVSANRYTNPLYRRSGINIGIFHDF